LVVATDGPEMIGTRLRAEYASAVRRGALTREARAPRTPASPRELHLRRLRRARAVGAWS
jgi:hypothetical protein